MPASICDIINSKSIKKFTSFDCSSCPQVGLLDIDICGPSVPRMLGLEGQEIHSSATGWSPVYVDDRLGVMSIGFLLPDQDDAVIWRGPRKNGLIKQFIKVGNPAQHVLMLPKLVAGKAAALGERWQQPRGCLCQTVVHACPACFCQAFLKHNLPAASA